MAYRLQPVGATIVAPFLYKYALSGVSPLNGFGCSNLFCWVPKPINISREISIITVRKIHLCFRELKLVSYRMDAFIFSLYVSVLVAFSSVFRKNAAMRVSNVVVSILATVGLSARLIADGAANAADKPATWIGIILFAMTFIDVYYASYSTNCDVKTAVEKLFRRKK